MTSASPREPRRVLVVSYEYPPLGGGGGVMIRDLVEELAKRIDVTVLTSGRRGLAAEEHHGKLEIVRAPVWMRTSDAVASLPSLLSFFPVSLRAGRGLLASRSYDLVHSSFAVPSGPSGLQLARRFRLPHVLSIHGGDIFDPSKWLSPHRTPLLKQTVRWVIHGSDRVVAQSSDTRRRAQAIYGERDIDCIPLAVRPMPFRSIPRQDLDLGLEPEQVVLITVGRLIARKALEQMIAILARIDDERLCLVVVGDGPQRSALEARAREAGIADRVRFTGIVSEERKWQLLAESDVYVSTALHEGFGIVFLEAMEMGLPVICYDCGGQADFLRDDFSRLIPSGNQEAFQRELVGLCNNAELRKRMGDVARREVKSFYVEPFAERYLEIYRECLGAAQRPPLRPGRGA